MTFLLLFFSAGLNAAASFCLKLLTAGGAPLGLATLQKPLLYLALALFGLNVVGYTLLLGRLPLASAYPAYVGATGVAVLALAYFVLHEQLSAGQLGGLLLILVGLMLTVR